MNDGLARSSVENSIRNRAQSKKNNTTTQHKTRRSREDGTNFITHLLVCLCVVFLSFLFISSIRRHAVECLTLHHSATGTPVTTAELMQVLSNGVNQSLKKRKEAAAAAEALGADSSTRTGRAASHSQAANARQTKFQRISAKFNDHQSIAQADSDGDADEEEEEEDESYALELSARRSSHSGVSPLPSSTLLLPHQLHSTSASSGEFVSRSASVSATARYSSASAEVSSRTASPVVSRKNSSPSQSRQGAL